VDIADCDADTALHAAASSLHLDIIKRLTEVLSDEALARLLERPNSKGRCPLACTFDKFQSGDSLYRSNDDDSAEAVKNIVSHLVELHKRLGVSIDLQDSERSTPLLMASKFGIEDAVGTLLANGAAPNIATDGGETPLTAAAQQGALIVMRMLLEAGADPHQTIERSKETALHLVMHTVGSEDDLVRISTDLLDAGADVNAMDAEDKSPIAWAAELRREKLVCVQILLF
jgi:ankyrin repeat protein